MHLESFSKEAQPKETCAQRQPRALPRPSVRPWPSHRCGSTLETRGLDCWIRCHALVRFCADPWPHHKVPHVQALLPLDHIFPEVHAGASCKRLRWSAGALRPLLTFRNTVTAERSCKRQMIFAPHVEQMRSEQHPEHNVIISRQQLLRETVVRRGGLWLEQWYPTTISQSTIGRIVDLSQQWNIRVENIIHPTPPDGNCLLYSIMACRKPDSWRHGRSALGFLSDRIQEQVEKEEAKNIKDSLIEHHEQLGNMAEASRLRLAGLKDIQTLKVFQFWRKCLAFQFSCTL